jgi:hypothetical protein
LSCTSLQHLTNKKEGHVGWIGVFAVNAQKSDLAECRLDWVWFCTVQTCKRRAGSIQPLLPLT